MSNFSHSLAEALSSLSWSQRRLCALTGFQEAQVSKYVRGALSPGTDSLAKLASVLPETERGRVVRGWLLDNIPPSASALITILTQGGIQEFPALLPDNLDPSVRDAIRFLSHRAVQFTEVRDMLIDLQRALSVGSGTVFHDAG